MGLEFVVRVMIIIRVIVILWVGLYLVLRLGSLLFLNPNKPIA